MAKRVQKKQQSDNTRRTSPQPKRRRRRRKYTLHYILLVLFCLGASVVLSLTVFFNTEAIEVEGLDKYTSDQIIKSSGIQMGDNLFRLSEKDIKESILNNYTYIEDVDLKRKIPATALLKITMAQPVAAICNQENSYTVVSDGLRVLECSVEQPDEKILRVVGMESVPMQVGDNLYTLLSKEAANKKAAKETVALKAEIDEKRGMLEYFLNAQSTAQLDKLNYVDFTDPYNLKALYDSRILIEFGSEAELVYKMNFAREIISTELPEDYEGTIDVSIDGELRTRPKEIEQALGADMSERMLQTSSQQSQDEGILQPVEQSSDIQEEASEEDSVSKEQSEQSSEQSQLE